MFVIASAVQGDGLTLRDVAQNIPHDAAAIVVYVMIAAFAAFVWHGSRDRTH